VPHLTVYAGDDDLSGREPALIAGLTEAVVSVYGEWARDTVEVRLIGLSERRWARGGRLVRDAAPAVTFGLREEVFQRDDADTVVAALVNVITEAVVAVFGEKVREAVLVELVGQPVSRTGLGGRVLSASS
jgi:phenylpyruvate tautomerase PptA (4-oxalocrotonate tautomerase family)